MHSVTRISDGRVSGSLESWRTADGDRRALLRRPDGRLVGEITIRHGVASSWNARSDELYLSRDTALDDDSLEQLSHAKAGHRGVSRRPDTTVRGIPVHVIVIAPTVAGEDPVPARTYYIDKDTDLPVRIAFGKTITDVLQAEQLRGAGSASELKCRPSVRQGARPALGRDLALRLRVSISGRARWPSAARCQMPGRAFRGAGAPGCRLPA